MVSTISMINVFVGYDPREAVVYHVCVNSLIRHSSVPLSITPLALKNLATYSEAHSDGSNDFIYSRFLVPHLMNYQGFGIYIDGDMLLRGDIAELADLADPEKAVQCVQHDYKTRARQKYMGSVNQDYPRKNWSSVIMWNCGHEKNRQLTPELIQTETGAYLHRFQWLDDSEVGALPDGWNWLPDEYGENYKAKLVHWTLGAPSFTEYADAPMAEEWHREKQLTDYCAQVQIEAPFERGY